MAYTCDHCTKAFKISEKKAYVTHLRTHAEKRIDEVYSNKLYAETKVFEERILSSNTFVEIASIIMEMSFNNMAAFKIKAKDLLSWRRDDRRDIYEYRMRGDITYSHCSYTEFGSKIIFKVYDPCDLLFINRLLGNRSGYFISSDNFLYLRINIESENKMMKKERIKYMTTKKLKS